MRKILGVMCVLTGILCLMAAAGLVINNQNEAEQAAQFSGDILVEVQNVIQQSPTASVLEIEPAETVSLKLPQEQSPDLQAEEEIAEPDPELQEMVTIQVDGVDCIGILSIPVLRLELPVLSDWSYEKLKMAPCVYYGSCFEPDFVIAGHNYQGHFYNLSQLRPKDLVFFTDASGNVYQYEVVLLETLSPEATEAMITSGFDLSLYTCTPGGGNRVTVRCMAVSS